MDDIGILGYGVAIPPQMLKTEAVVRYREGKEPDIDDKVDKIHNGLRLRYKAVATPGEDSTTLAYEAALNALDMSGISPSKIDMVSAGSESKSYAVGQIARAVADFVGVGNRVMTNDLEAACAPAMHALYLTYGMIKADKIKYGLVIGSDVSQSPPRDALEYSTGCGAGAFVVGRGDIVASLDDFSPFGSFTLDFWRRDGEPHPAHFGRTTVKAYMEHTTGAVVGLLEKHPELSLADFTYIPFHQPSGYMPIKTAKAWSGIDDDIKPQDLIQNPEIAKRMRLTKEQIKEKIESTFVVEDIGNPYAASTPIATAKTLDIAKPGDTILAITYGSGAHSLATMMTVQDGIRRKRGKVPSYQAYLDRRNEINIFEFLALQVKKVVGWDFPRFVGIVEPDPGCGEFTQSYCNACESIFFPARNNCLKFEDKQPLIQRKLPKVGKLESLRKLSKIERSRPYKALRGEEVPLVSYRDGDLTRGMGVEGSIKRLYTHGKNGIIIYAVTYQPKLRAAWAERERQMIDRLYENPPLESPQTVTT